MYSAYIPMCLLRNWRFALYACVFKKSGLAIVCLWFAKKLENAWYSCVFNRSGIAIVCLRFAKKLENILYAYVLQRYGIYILFCVFLRDYRFHCMPVFLRDLENTLSTDVLLYRPYTNELCPITGSGLNFMVQLRWFCPKCKLGIDPS